MKQLSLVVPGLLGPFSDELPAYIQQQLKQPDSLLINKCFSKSIVQPIPVSTYFETLVYLIHAKNKKSLCQLTAEIDGVDLTDGYFYRADPVHFKAESDHAVLIGTELLLPTQQESKQLIKIFNQHFLDDGLSIHFSDASRWYLKSKKSLNLSFTPVDYAMGRDIKHFMPEGEDALWWRKMLNEAQMLFFQDNVNELREMKGELTINGLWLWDEKMHAIDEASESIKQVFADDVVSLALTQQQNIDALPSKKILNIDSIALVVKDDLYQSVCYGDVDAWLNDFSLFCKNEFQAIFELLISKKIQVLNIYPCNGQVYTLKRLDLLKFWKKTKTINYFF